MTQDYTPMVCQGHEELRDIAIETRSSVDNLNKNLAMFIERSDECDKRIRNLELNGAKVSQTNAKDIEILKSDVDILKSNEDVRKGIEKRLLYPQLQGQRSPTDLQWLRRLRAGLLPNV